MSYPEEKSASGLREPIQSDGLSAPPTVHFRTAMSIIGQFSLFAEGGKIPFPQAAQRFTFFLQSASELPLLLSSEFLVNRLFCGGSP